VYVNALAATNAAATTAFVKFERYMFLALPYSSG
jgi:hypothetical protein